MRSSSHLTPIIDFTTMAARLPILSSFLFTLLSHLLYCFILCILNINLGVRGGSVISRSPLTLIRLLYAGIVVVGFNYHTPQLGSTSETGSICGNQLNQPPSIKKNINKKPSPRNPSLHPLHSSPPVQKIQPQLIQKIQPQLIQKIQPQLIQKTLAATLFHSNLLSFSPLSSVFTLPVLGFALWPFPRSPSPAPHLLLPPLSPLLSRSLSFSDFIGSFGNQPHRPPQFVGAVRYGY